MAAGAGAPGLLSGVHGPEEQFGQQTLEFRTCIGETTWKLPIAGGFNTGLGVYAAEQEQPGDGTAKNPNGVLLAVAGITANGGNFALARALFHLKRGAVKYYSAFPVLTLVCETPLTSLRVVWNHTAIPHVSIEETITAPETEALPYLADLVLEHTWTFSSLDKPPTQAMDLQSDVAAEVVVADAGSDDAADVVGADSEPRPDIREMLWVPHGAPPHGAPSP